MKSSAFNSAAHFSVVWGVTLAVVTLVEWHSLDRDPVRQEIFSPFIERHISVTVDEAQAPVEPDTAGSNPDAGANAALNYEVEFNFNGPLFLAAFFVPVLIIQGAGTLVTRFRKPRKEPL